MKWYARGAPGAVPTYTRNPAFLAVGGEEVVVEVEEVPDNNVVIAADGLSLVPAPQSTEMLWHDIKAARFSLLLASDWIMQPDSPVTEDCRTAWIAYRKALNRITVDYDDPTKVVWPPAPSITY